MSFPSLRTLIGLGGALVMFFPVPAEAQIVRRFAGGGVQIRAPFVRVNVGPYGGTSVRAPLVAVDPGGVRVGLRRRLAPMPQPLGPQQVAPAQAQIPSGGLPDGYVPFPTAEELAAMDDRALFTALSDLAYGLDVRLSRLNTGTGWQRYLRISDSVLVAPEENLDQLVKTLGRFDSVSDNPEFAKIAGLPSFIATKAALRQVVARLDEPRTAESAGDSSNGPVFPSSTESSSAGEILPTPATSVVPEASRGEHSILKRASRD